MKLDIFNPTFDDLMALDERILWKGGDVWKVNQDGVPHRYISKFGDLLTVKLPDNIPVKYKGRKATRVVIWCNACDLVTGIEVHYTGNHVLQFKNPDSTEYREIC